MASGDCTELYAAGTPVPLTPVAAGGSSFAGWSGNPDCTDGSVTMDASKTCTATFTLGPASPTITNGPPPDGTVGIAYVFTYTSTGSPTFSVTAGSLPPDLTLSSAGVISGTPTTAGTFTGTVTATNGTAPDATQDFSIIISLGGAAEIPTLGGWGAILLVLSLLALALRRLRSAGTTAS